MDELKRMLEEIEKSMDKVNRIIESQISRSAGNKKSSYIKFYAKREFDSKGKDVQEAYMEVDGKKKYWKKDGDKEILLEPKEKDGAFIEKIWHEFLPKPNKPKWKE